MCFTCLKMTKTINGEFVAMDFRKSNEANFFISPPNRAIRVLNFSFQSALQLWFRPFLNSWAHEEIWFLKLYCSSSSFFLFLLLFFFFQKFYPYFSLIAQLAQVHFLLSNSSTTHFFPPIIFFFNISLFLSFLSFFSFSLFLFFCFEI